MTTQALSLVENRQRTINHAIRELQRGRSNAHGTFTLNGNNSDTELVVSAPNCATGSHVSITPKSANAAAQWAGGDMYIVTGNQQFTVTHGTTSNSDETFTYGIVG